MTKYKVGDEFSDDEGWRSVEEINNDGYIVLLDREGNDFVVYNRDNDLSLDEGDFRGIVLKISADKNLKAYSKKYYISRALAKYHAENEVKKARPKKLYYRIEDTILSICSTCNKTFQKSDGCGYCEKMGNK